jgi:hypothetical protein
MLPENSLVPDLVTTLTLPAVEPESLTSKSTTLTFTCSTESSDIGERTPGYPPYSRPKSSDWPIPSTLKVLYRAFAPAIEILSVSSPLKLTL